MPLYLKKECNQNFSSEYKDNKNYVTTIKIRNKSFLFFRILTRKIKLKKK